MIDKNLSLQGLRPFDRGVTIRSPAKLTPGAPPNVEMDGEFGTTGSLDARNTLVDGFFGDGILGLGFGDERAEIRVVESVVSGGPRRPGLFQAGIIVAANARAVLRDNAIGPIYCTHEECGEDLVEGFQGVALGTDAVSGDDHVVANNFMFGTGPAAA